MTQFMSHNLYMHYFVLTIEMKTLLITNSEICSSLLHMCTLYQYSLTLSYLWVKKNWKKRTMFASIFPFPSMLWFSFFFNYALVQLLSHIWLFATPWIAACQASLSTISRSLLKFLSTESVIPSNHLVLCHLLLLLPAIFPSIRVCFNELTLWIRWPKYWSFSFSISPSNEYSWLISFRID